MLALYDNDPLGLIAKQFGAALASAGNLLANGLAANGINLAGLQPPQGLPPVGAGMPSAFSQPASDQNRLNTFMAPSTMVPPPIAPPPMATTAFSPPPNQGAFSAPSAYPPPSYGGGQPYGTPANAMNGPAYSNSQGFAPQPSPQTPAYAQAPAVAPSNIQQISDLNRAAAQATARRDFEEAISKLQDARHLAPNDQLICRNLGLALGNAANVAVQQGEYGRALQYYKNALDVLKTNADKSAYDQILSDYQSMVNKQSSAH